MPAVSGKQYRFMAMMAHNPEKARAKGVPSSVAREFVEKTPASKRSSFMKTRGRKMMVGGK